MTCGFDQRPACSRAGARSGTRGIGSWSALQSWDEGRTWLDSAFVVNDWYISAYEPLVDSYGKRVGMLYVGFLQKAVQRREVRDAADHRARIHRDHGGNRADLPALGAVDIHAARTRHDDDRRRWRAAICPPAPNCRHPATRSAAWRFTSIPCSDQIQERDRQLREWNEELNTRVRERTRDLEHANPEAGGDHQAAHHVREARRDRRDHRRRGA
jgi:hypothetical protein